MLRGCWLTIFAIAGGAIAPRAVAQIVPDGSTGTQVRSQEVRGRPSEAIEGGTIRDSNLFHSFQEFNIETGRGAYFANPEGIDNILTRVTGGNRSVLNGTLGVLGDANLFFLNPNGIVFGAGSRLDLRGSFLGTTAESLLFEGYEFSARNTDTPPLLTFNRPLGLQIGDNPGEISLRSQFESTSSPVLAVAEGQSLTLVGGDVSLEVGTILSPGATIQLGGLSEPGIVQLQDDFTAVYPDGTLRADVRLSEGSVVNTRGEGGDRIEIIARHLELDGESHLFAGLASTNRTDIPSGGIVIDAQGNVSLSGDSQIETANASAIAVTAANLSLDEGSRLNTATQGTADAGAIALQVAQNLTLQGASEIASNTSGAGNAGNIDIIAASLALTDGGTIDASTSGSGNTGQITIRASGPVTVEGVDREGNPSRIESEVDRDSTGDSLGIAIEAGSFALLDGARIDTSTDGNGDAGQITLRASGSVTVQGSDGQGNASQIASEVERDAVGDSLGIAIEAASVTLLDGGTLDTSTRGLGDAGPIAVRTSGPILVQGASVEMDASQITSDVNREATGDSQGIAIEAASVTLLDGARIDTSTDGNGDAGRITLRASGSVTVQGSNGRGDASQIASEVERRAEGDSLGIAIDAARLTLLNGGTIDTSTRGLGNAGEITVRTSGPILVQGASVEMDPSQITSDVNREATGDSQGIAIEAASLTLAGGGTIDTRTRGLGNAGLITIRTSGPILVQGTGPDNDASRITSEVERRGTGDSQGIQIEAASLSILDGGDIDASTSSTGNAGEIAIAVSGDILISGVDVEGMGSRIESEVESDGTGESFGIRLSAANVTLADEGTLNSGTLGEGDAGPIAIAATGDVTLETGASIESRVQDEGMGDAGGIEIEAARLSVEDSRISASTLAEGDAGTIAISVTGDVLLRDDAQIESQVRDEGMGDAGGIEIDAANLRVEDSRISANTLAEGDAGTIAIAVTEDVILRDDARLESQVREEAVGNAGGIEIDTARLSIEDSLISASTLGAGDAGAIAIRASESLTQQDGGISSQVRATGMGDSDGIAIETGSLTLNEGSSIVASTLGDGDAGRIAIAATGDILLEGQGRQDGNSGENRIVTEVRDAATGNSAGMEITAASLTLRDGSFISASTFGSGDAGEIAIAVSGEAILERAGRSRSNRIISQVNEGVSGNSEGISISAARLILRDSSSVSASTQGSGNAGEIAIAATESVTLESDTVLSVETSASGQPGNIAIAAPNLTLAENARLSATATSTSTSEGRGSITLATSVLEISGELGIFAETNSAAPAGNLTLVPNGSDTDLAIQFLDAGFISASTTAAGTGGNITLSAPNAIAISGEGQIAVATSGAGPAGTIAISTSQLQVSDRAQISAASTGSGSAGAIEIVAGEFDLTSDAGISTQATSTGAAGNIFLDVGDGLALSDRAAISADTSSGQGNIEIDAGQVRFENQSRITTNATGTAGGGNIAIAAPFLIAFPESNSDITANGEEGSGGQIAIAAEGIFGLVSRTREGLVEILGSSDPQQLDPGLLTSNDITAFSQARPEVDLGTVQVETPEVDPTAGIVSLPGTPLDASGLLRDRCAATAGSRFTSVGRGGLPPGPETLLPDETVLLAKQEVPEIVAQAWTWQQQGFYRRSRVALAELVQTLDREPDSLVKAIALRHYGTALRLSGDLEMSARVLEQSLALAETLAVPDEIAATALSAGYTKSSLGDRSVALEFYQQAIALATEPTLRLQALVAAYGATDSPIQLGDLEAAIAAQLPQTPPALATVYARLNYINARLQADGMEALAIATVEQMPSLTREIEGRNPSNSELERATSYALGTLGKIYAEQSRWREAEQVTEQALFLAQAIAAPDIVYQWQWQLGRIANQQGETQGAIAAYEAAVKTLESLRSDLASIGPDAQFEFRQNVEPVYREAIALWLQAQQPEPAALVRARSLLEGLQLAELDNFFQDDCLQANPVQIDAIDSAAAAIYPIILPDRLAVILSLPGEPLHYHSIPIEAGEVEEAIATSLQYFALSAFGESEPIATQQLYEWLLRPAEKRLAAAGIETLVFVLDGNLRNLPMAALFDGESFLIERYNLAVAPSLDLLPSSPRSPSELELLAGGLSEARQGFIALPEVETELARIAEVVPQTQAFLNREFTEAQVRSQIARAPFNVLHLATHGQFGSSAEETFILTWDERLNVKEFGSLLQTRQRFFDMPIELLVLSACETATGDDRAVLGIAGMAVRSGARSTIASLWPLSDEAAAVFMMEFYDALAVPGTTKGEAFRAAQLALLNDPRFSAPFFWAPFVLVGNWL